MQVGSITCASQRFALTRCHCSSQERKPRQRKSKEERRVLVETFITTYRNTNKGSFPSLKRTHKEVGGSFYIVREIVRDIIQENRVLGPGGLDMQSLTLEDAPIQPEICENGRASTGADLHLETGSEEDYILVESVNQGSNESSELLKKNLFGSGSLNLDLTSEKFFEQMEVLDSIKTDSNLAAEEDCTNYTGKQPTNDVLESDSHKNEDILGSEINMITESIDEPKIEMKKGEISKVSETDCSLPFNETIKVDLLVGPTDTSDSNGGFEGSRAVENGDIGKDSAMEMRMDTVDKSKSETNEVNCEVLESNGKFFDSKSEKLNFVVQPMNLNAGVEMPRAVEKDPQEMNSEIKKEGRGESSESNTKMPFNENKKSNSLAGSTETSGPNGGFEMGRAVVEVEQFPLPRANISLNSEGPDCVSATAGAEEREKELVEVKAPAAVISKTVIKSELQEPSFGKSLDTVSRAEHGAILNNATTTKGNRESAEKMRGKAENNPFWNTIRAFVTAIVKFWSE